MHHQMPRGEHNIARMDDVMLVGVDDDEDEWIQQEEQNYSERGKRREPTVRGRRI